MFTPIIPNSSSPRRSSRNDASTCGSGSDTSALNRSGIRTASAAVRSLPVEAAASAADLPVNHLVMHQQYIRDRSDILGLQLKFLPPIHQWEWPPIAY